MPAGERVDDQPLWEQAPFRSETTVRQFFGGDIRCLGASTALEDQKAMAGSSLSRMSCCFHPGIAQPRRLHVLCCSKSCEISVDLITAKSRYRFVMQLNDVTSVTILQRQHSPSLKMRGLSSALSKAALSNAIAGHRSTAFSGYDAMSPVRCPEPATEMSADRLVNIYVSAISDNAASQMWADGLV